MSEDPSDRLIDQRIRNRIMEDIETLADGAEGVRRVGPIEYFESFYDWIPYCHHGPMRFNSALAAEERALLSEVSRILDEACDATPSRMTIDEFIATGWPGRIQPVARRALDLMHRRGRFNEEREENDPSS